MKLLFNNRFIVFLAVVLLFQSFNSLDLPTKKESVHTTISGKVPTNNQGSPFELYIEEESSEEDENKHDYSSINTLKYRLFSFQEIFYTATIKTRYLNIVSSKLHTIETPLIILHHTWKSDLV